MPPTPPRYVSTAVFEPKQSYPNDGVPARFAFNLRRARHAAGLSQQQLGDRCGLHRTEISLLERAGREPRLGTIVKLAGALEQGNFGSVQTTAIAQLLL